jgi:2-polyprenyl-3-methyl-5-hydroxy-6-metoxy-1,4-benzoquinol methylase
MPSTYIPELYWDEVARQINRREGANLVAGDDEPYYRYKRNKFLELLHSIDFAGKKILEVGSGPGGNLIEIYKQNPAELYGADISDEMITLAKKNTVNSGINILKINGSELPFDDRHFDIVITATVLQHITDEKVVQTLIKNMCRATESDIYIFERIEQKRMEAATNTGRTVNEYTAIFAANGFFLQTTRYAHIHISYAVCGMARKIFNRGSRREAERVSRFSAGVQKAILPVTKQLDKLFRQKRDLAMLHFKRISTAI